MIGPDTRLKQSRGTIILGLALNKALYQLFLWLLLLQLYLFYNLFDFIHLLALPYSTCDRQPLRLLSILTMFGHAALPGTCSSLLDTVVSTNVY